MNSLFRKIALPVVLLGAIFFASGCGTLDQQYASAIKQSADLILPDYVQYVEKDPALDDDSKKLRKDNVKELERLLSEGVGGE